MKKSKPEGRLAKRMAFYALNRRKAQGRSVLRQLRAALPAKAEQQAVDSLSTVYGDEWEAPTFDAFRARARNYDPPPLHIECSGPFGAAADHTENLLVRAQRKADGGGGHQGLLPC